MHARGASGPAGWPGAAGSRIRLWPGKAGGPVRRVRWGSVGCFGRAGGCAPVRACGTLCFLRHFGIGCVAQDWRESTGPFTVSTPYESGSGRVAVDADDAFEDHGFEGRNNAPLARALLERLTGEQDAYAQPTIVPAVGGE